MKVMMSNIYYRLHFMVCESYENSNNSTRNTILDMVTKIHKETLDESGRQKRI